MAHTIWLTSQSIGRKALASLSRLGKGPGPSGRRKSKDNRPPGPSFFFKGLQTSFLLRHHPASSQNHHHLHQHAFGSARLPLSQVPAEPHSNLLLGAARSTRSTQINYSSHGLYLEKHCQAVLDAGRVQTGSLARSRTVALLFIAERKATSPSSGRAEPEEQGKRSKGKGNQPAHLT